MANNYAPPSDISRFQGVAVGVGLMGLIAWIVAVFLSGNRAQAFYQSYLVAYIFLIGISLGCLGLLMVAYLGGAGWGLVIRRQLEAASHTLILMAVLFIPILLGLGHLYEWVHPEHAGELAQRLINHRRPYLNTPFFITRVVIYFFIWITLALVLRRFSLQQDNDGDLNAVQRAQNWSGPGFFFFAIAVTFAAFDWVMALDPEWFSTIFGMLMLAGQGVSALAFLITINVALSRREPMSHVLQPKHFHDLGKLQLALVMVWAYFSFSQLLIIWSGNLPEEIPWYLERFRGVWRYVGLSLIILHFALPFLLLLSRDLKRDGRRLKYVAWLILTMRFIDLLWVIVPEFENRHVEAAAHHFNPAGYIIYFLAAIGLGGIWLGWFFWQLRSRALIPANDPQLPEALAAAGHH